MESLQNIIAPLVYFDIFSYPLTAGEIFSFILCQDQKDEPLDFEDFLTYISENEEFGKIAKEKDGFYFIGGGDEFIKTRKERFRISVKKYKRALRVAKILSLLPFTRMIAVCNSLSYSNARQESDIDFFIITKRGGAWWARFLSLIVLEILLLRPKQGDCQNKICLSFFIDEDNLDIRQFSSQDDDIYLVYWLATVYPICDFDGMYQKFWEKNSDFIKSHLPNCNMVFPHQSRFFSKRAGRAKKSIESFLSVFNFFIIALQKWLFPKDIKDLSKSEGSEVLAKRGVLKFHTRDKRKEYNFEFKNRMDRINQFLKDNQNYEYVK